MSSDYEAQRAANIARNLALLAELGIGGAEDGSASPAPTSAPSRAPAPRRSASALSATPVPTSAAIPASTSQQKQQKADFEDAQEPDEAAISALYYSEEWKAKHSVPTTSSTKRAQAKSWENTLTPAEKEELQSYLQQRKDRQEKKQTKKVQKRERKKRRRMREKDGAKKESRKKRKLTHRELDAESPDQNATASDNRNGAVKTAGSSRATRAASRMQRKVEEEEVNGVASEAGAHATDNDENDEEVSDLTDSATSSADDSIAHARRKRRRLKNRPFLIADHRRLKAERAEERARRGGEEEESHRKGKKRKRGLSHSSTIIPDSEEERNGIENGDGSKASKVEVLNGRSAKSENSVDKEEVVGAADDSKVKEEPPAANGIAATRRSPRKSTLIISERVAQALAPARRSRRAAQPLPEKRQPHDTITLSSSSEDNDSSDGGSVYSSSDLSSDPGSTDESDSDSDSDSSGNGTDTSWKSFSELAPLEQERIIASARRRVLARAKARAQKTREEDPNRRRSARVKSAAEADAATAAAEDKALEGATQEEIELHRSRFGRLRKLRNPSPGTRTLSEKPATPSSPSNASQQTKVAEVSAGETSWSLDRIPRITEFDPRLPSFSQLVSKKRRKIQFEPGYLHFQPSLTPSEMFVGGCFGGTGFKRHHSRVLKRWLEPEEELRLRSSTTPEGSKGRGSPSKADTPAEAEMYKDFITSAYPTWRSDRSFIERYLISSNYDLTLNRFRVKASQSLSDWELAGWIAEQDPRGWFQWYLRFFYGRRSPDDERQISRWLKACGPNGRFRRQLAQKIKEAGASWDDPSISPVIRQTLWHWGYQLTEGDYKAYL